jgi:hypothetical protein
VTMVTVPHVLFRFPFPGTVVAAVSSFLNLGPLNGGPFFLREIAWIKSCAWGLTLPLQLG